MDTILFNISTCSSQLFILLLLGIIMTCLNIVSSMTMQDQTPSATEFGDNFFRNLTSSTIKDSSLAHITQIHIMDEWPAMLIGANNSIHVFDLNQQERTAKILEWVPDLDAKGMCYLKGKEEEDCQNYIKVITPDKRNGKLLICGTYAQKPRCVNLEANKSSLESQWEQKDTNWTDGLYKCPFNIHQKSTAVFADGSLYSGTVADFNARESVLTRSMGNTDIYPPLITKRSDSIWLNLPEFIKSYQEDNEVFFFFREISIETQHTGKMYYSRIARVCTNDKGGSTILDSTWTTFLKARLDCSFHGDFPFHFNYLQDVVRVVEGEGVFYYGIFTTGDHEIPASAVCRFNLDEIRDNFNNGLFKQTSAPWQPVPAANVPVIRPGSCSAESTQLSNEDLNFIKSHPLMYEPVKNYGQDDPLFTLTRSNYRLNKLVTTKKGPYTIVFAGTDDGHVMKLVLRENHPVGGMVSPVLLYNMHVMEDKQPITNMRLYKNNGQEVIFVTSKDVIVELSPQYCQYLKNCSCKQDPYCSWIESSSKCIVSISTNEDYSGVELDCKDPITDVDWTLKDCTDLGSPSTEFTTIVTTPSAASTTTVVVTTTTTPEPAKLGTTYRQTTNLETTLTRQDSGNEMHKLEASDWPTEKLFYTQTPTHKPPELLADEEVKSDASKQSTFDESTKTFIVLAIVGWAICLIEMAGLVCWCLMRKNKGVVMVTTSSMEKIHRNMENGHNEPPKYTSTDNTLSKPTPNGKHIPNGKHTPNGKLTPNGHDTPNDKLTPNGKLPHIDSKEIHEIRKRMSQGSCGRGRGSTLEKLHKIGNGRIACSDYEGFSDSSDGPSPTQSTNEVPPTYSQSFDEGMSLVLEMEPHLKRISSVNV
ncbi:semaphorin-1A-like isoform X3 [Anneissia japonica]|uniref:semaphorin-1A-like isoform X3 n=1 Tax=Anneissia japonica TaxID=1529436 RepID=UPI0014254E3E|nr:semaphorin-1A-like isoform X3 [Anneissia japonica]